MVCSNKQRTRANEAQALMPVQVSGDFLDQVEPQMDL